MIVSTSSRLYQQVVSTSSKLINLTFYWRDSFKISSIEAKAPRQFSDVNCSFYDTNLLVVVIARLRPTYQSTKLKSSFETYKANE